MQDTIKKNYRVDLKISVGSSFRSDRSLHPFHVNWGLDYENLVPKKEEQIMGDHHPHFGDKLCGRLSWFTIHSHCSYNQAHLQKKKKELSFKILDSFLNF